MQRLAIPDELLGAYHDHELDPATRAWLAAELAADPALHARLTAIVNADGWIKAAFAVDETPQAAMNASVKTSVGGRWPQVAALAAMLLLGVFMGAQWPNGDEATAIGPHALSAHLETQPIFQQVMEQRLSGEAENWESQAVANGHLMPVETYRLTSGTYCRRFLLDAPEAQLSGVVCRDQQAVWRIQQLAFNAVSNVSKPLQSSL